MPLDEPPEPNLDAVQSLYPDMDIYAIAFSYIAVPKGIKVHKAMFLSTLIEKMEAEAG